MSQCGSPDELLLLLLLPSLLRTADRAPISLVWSSQMEPEHDLFPGETVCFLCPACTKSCIVPLPISHADSPLQVLGYLADGGSDFISFFLFFWPTARNIVYPSLLHLSAQSKYGTHQFWGFIPHKWLPVIPYSAHFLQGKKDSLLTLRLHPVYSLTRVRPGCWDRWWSSLTTPGESLLPLLLNNVNLNWIYEGTPTDT